MTAPLDLSSLNLDPIQTTPNSTRKSLQSDFKIKSTSSTKLSRSSSLRSKGFNIYAVSPAETPTPTKEPQPTNPISTPELKPTDPSTKTDLKYDVALPPIEKLSSLKIDEQLRLLALKEMSVVEIKDSIKTLTSKLSVHEQELQKLRRVIQSSLHKELRTAATTHDPNSQRTNSKSSHSQNTNTPKILQESNTANMLWNGISKPLNMLDTLLQQEFEKSLIPEQTITTRTHRSRSSQGSFSSIGSNSSPLRGKSKILSNQPPPHERHSFATDDMIQTVSSSIWSFVNDVKENVLSSLTDEDYTITQNKEHSSNDITNPTITQNELLSDCENAFDLLDPEVTDEEEEEDKLDLSMYRK